MKSNKANIKSCLGPLILIVFFIFIYVKTEIIDKNKIDSNNSYTIGTVTCFDGSAEGCPNINFCYYINDKRYDGFFTNCGEYDSIKIGDKFYVKYYPLNPKNSNIMLDSIISK